MTREELILRIEKSKETVHTKGMHPSDLRGLINSRNLSQFEVVTYIERAVCDYYMITPEELKGDSRKGILPKARQAFMILARITTTATTKVIAGKVGLGHSMSVLAMKIVPELDKPWNSDIRIAIMDISERIANMLPKRKPINEEIRRTAKEINMLITSRTDTDTPTLYGPHKYISELIEMAVIAEERGVLADLVDRARGFTEETKVLDQLTA